MIVEAFDAEAAILAARVEGLSAADLRSATRCGSWDALTTVAHVIKGLERAAAMVSSAAHGIADTNPLIYYQSAQRSDPSRDKVRQDAAIASAARFATGEQLADAIHAATGAVTVFARKNGLDSTVETHWGPAMRLDDYLRTRVVEMVVHGIDLADALQLQVWATPIAVAEVAKLVRELVGEELPPGLAWSDLELVRLGTGRGELTRSDRSNLGTLSASFPAIQ